jgi:biofilm PGA synthesis N-glycosyltransferase PgaC
MWDKVMGLVFWISLVVVVYAYVGYALWLMVRGGKRPIRCAYQTPTVSILIAARNEEVNLPVKLENLRSLDYPAEKIQIVIASDGSTDRTAAILRDQPGNVFPVIFEQSVGKAAALNQAVRHATGEILVFLDARQRVDLNAVSELVSCLADPTVGAVSGELHLEAAPGVEAGDALGIYWKIEKTIRRLESESGSVVGVTGAIYAIRRELYTDIPPGTILDDVFVPMNVARMGKRVIFHPLAIARDRIFTQQGKEFARKVRTLTGNYQLLQMSPWMLSDENPLLFRLICHKLLRLVVPFLLLVMLVTSGLAGGLFFRTIFGLQLILYAVAALGMLIPPLRRFRPVAIAHTFVMLNVAAAYAFYNFVAGRKNVWV